MTVEYGLVIMGIILTLTGALFVWGGNKGQRSRSEFSTFTRHEECFWYQMPWGSGPWSRSGVTVGEGVRSEFGSLVTCSLNMASVALGAWLLGGGQVSL